MRNHVAQVYGEYMKSCMQEWQRFDNDLLSAQGVGKQVQIVGNQYFMDQMMAEIDDDILIKKIVVKPVL